jgi:hypothetical protein
VSSSNGTPISSGIGLFAVLDSVDIDSLRTVADAVEKAIVSDAEAIPVFTGQFEASWRTGLLG